MTIRISLLGTLCWIWFTCVWFSVCLRTLSKLISLQMRGNRVLLAKNPHVLYDYLIKGLLSQTINALTVYVCYPLNYQSRFNDIYVFKRSCCLYQFVQTLLVAWNIFLPRNLIKWKYFRKSLIQGNATRHCLVVHAIYICFRPVTSLYWY